MGREYLHAIKIPLKKVNIWALNKISVLFELNKCPYKKYYKNLYL